MCVKWGLPAQSPTAHTPGGRGPQPLVDLDEAPVVPLDPGRLQADAVGVRRPSARDQEVRALDHAAVALACSLTDSPERPSTRSTRVPVRTSIPSSSKSSSQGLRDVAILAVGQGVVPLDDRHAAAEASHGLGQLEPDVSAPQDEEVIRDAVQFEGLDVRHRPRLGEAGDRVDPRAGARADHDDVAAEGARPAVVGRDLDRLRPDEAALAHDELRAALPVPLVIQGDHPVDHLPLAVADGGHVDFPVARGDPELGASAEIAGDLRAVDQVLAREARDAGAGPRDIPPLDDRRPLPLRGQRPGEEPAPPAAEHHQVVFLGMRHVFPPSS